MYISENNFTLNNFPEDILLMILTELVSITPLPENFFQKKLTSKKFWQIITKYEDKLWLLYFLKNEKKSTYEIKLHIEFPEVLNSGPAMYYRNKTQLEGQLLKELYLTHPDLKKKPQFEEEYFTTKIKDDTSIPYEEKRVLCRLLEASHPKNNINEAAFLKAVLEIIEKVKAGLKPQFMSESVSA